MDFDELMSRAAVFHAAGVCGPPDKVKVESIAAAMMLAEAEGKPAQAGPRDYSVISGRPAKKSEAMLRDFIGAGGHVEYVTTDATCCVATFTHPSSGGITVRWDAARVQKAQIKNPVYQTHPAPMYRARALSEGIRATHPGSTNGTYSPEEIADTPALQLQGEAPKVAPAAADVIAHAKRIAASGVEAFRAYWADTPRSIRESLITDMEEFQSIAQEADAKRLETQAKAALADASPSSTEPANAE